MEIGRNGDKRKAIDYNSILRIYDTLETRDVKIYLPDASMAMPAITLARMIG
jgi:hypothetical protein